MKKKAGKLSIIIFFLLIIIFAETVLIINKSTAQQPATYQPPDIQDVPKILPAHPTQETPITMSTATEIPYLKPAYITILRSYDIDKSHNIWHAKDPSSYIIPNNEWVRYYASQLFIDKDGWIKYKNEKVVALVDTKGTILAYDYKAFRNNYVYDSEQFGSHGLLANDDYWANADYYLTHGMKGDCDEWMIAVTSMMLSGEMSVWEGDKLVKQIIPTKAVMGYVVGIRDGWVEYQVYDKIWLTSTSREKNPETNGYYSATIFIEKNNDFKPVFEFTDTYFRSIL